MVRSDFNMQFSGSYFPQESYGPTRLPLYREAESPSVQRRRASVTPGMQVQANPGMAGKQDRMQVKMPTAANRLGKP